jgi:peptidoglycan/LPS O-acetylase OafA/YrhL
LSLALGFAAEWPKSLYDVGTTLGLQRLLAQLALLNAFWHKAMFRLNWAAWSLSAEALMYLCFPWMLGALARRSRFGLWAVMLGCWGALFVVPALYGALDPDKLGRQFSDNDEVLFGWYLKFFPLQRLPEFVAGAAAALLVRRARMPAKTVNVGGFAAAAGLIAFLLWGRAPYAYVQAGAMLPLHVALVVFVAAGTEGLSRVLKWGPLPVLGRASYVTYILHVPLFLLLAKGDALLWNRLEHVAGYCAALLAVSLAVHRWVEEPARKAIAWKWCRSIAPRTAS